MMCQKYQSEWMVYNFLSAFLSRKMIYIISAVFSGDYSLGYSLCTKLPGKYLWNADPLRFYAMSSSHVPNTSLIYIVHEEQCSVLQHFIPSCSQKEQQNI